MQKVEVTYEDLLKESDKEYLDEVDGVGEEGGKNIIVEDSKSCIKKK